MQVHRLERNVVGVKQSLHDHARHPEEQDVIARFHHRGRVEAAQIGRVIWPAQRRERPKARAEPGI